MSNFHIYKKNIHYNLGKIQKKCIDKKVLFLLQGKHYIQKIHISGAKYKRKKRVSSIYKKTPIISVSIHYSLGKIQKKRKGLIQAKYHIYKEISKKNTYMRLCKSSLPNLKYCYIKRAASFSHWLQPFSFAILAFAFYFNHFPYI